MIPEATPITDSVIENAIKNAVANVCHTMIKHEATFVEKLSAEGVAGQNFGMLGTVGFVGNANGIVYLCMSLDFAREATSHILGMTTSEVDYSGPEVIKD